jgi:hypothetical protein
VREHRLGKGGSVGLDPGAPALASLDPSESPNMVAGSRRGDGDGDGDGASARGMLGERLTEGVARGMGHTGRRARWLGWGRLRRL